MTVKEVPKPFGFSDDKGFYSYKSNSLALETARHLLGHISNLEYLALSGYVIRDYPENTPDSDYDWKYHLILGIDSKSSSQEQIKFEHLKKLVDQSYQEARTLSRTYWHHGPLKTVPFDLDEMIEKANQGKIEELVPATFLHSLVFSAVPLWERPYLLKNWNGYSLTPFEYLQQFVFQFHQEKPVQEEVYISRVTGDKAERFIL